MRRTKPRGAALIRIAILFVTRHVFTKIQFVPDFYRLSKLLFFYNPLFLLPSKFIFLYFKLNISIFLFCYFSTVFLVFILHRPFLS